MHQGFSRVARHGTTSDVNSGGTLRFNAIGMLGAIWVKIMRLLVFVSAFVAGWMRRQEKQEKDSIRGELRREVSTLAACGQLSDVRQQLDKVHTLLAQLKESASEARTPRSPLYRQRDAHGTPTSTTPSSQMRYPAASNWPPSVMSEPATPRGPTSAATIEQGKDSMPIRDMILSHGRGCSEAQTPVSIPLAAGRRVMGHSSHGAASPRHYAPNITGIDVVDQHTILDGQARPSRISLSQRRNSYEENLSPLALRDVDCVGALHWTSSHQSSTTSFASTPSSPEWTYSVHDQKAYIALHSFSNKREADTVPLAMSGSGIRNRPASVSPAHGKFCESPPSTTRATLCNVDRGRDAQALFSGARHNRVEVVQELLGRSTHLNDARDQHGNTCLMLACQNGNKRIAKTCLRIGGDINAVNGRGMSALDFCNMFGYGKLASYLAGKGAVSGGGAVVQRSDGVGDEAFMGEEARVLEFGQQADKGEGRWGIEIECEGDDSCAASIASTARHTSARGRESFVLGEKREWGGQQHGEVPG